jgi:hypothetical protein
VADVVLVDGDAERSDLAAENHRSHRRSRQRGSAIMPSILPVNRFLLSLRLLIT